MLNNHFMKFGKVLVFPLFIFVLVFSTYVFFVPKAYLGKAFFGGSDVLYNIKIAHFFYNQSLVWDKKDGLPPPYVHHQLSRLAFIEGDLVVAMEEIYKELDAYPEHTHTYYIMGLTLGYMNREREAIESFSKFIAYKPESWAARNDKSWLQFRVGDIDGAMVTILPAAQNNPDNPWVLNTFGVLLMNQGHLPEAKKAFTRALEVSYFMNEKNWGVAYPGNSPEIYGMGLNAMRISISENLSNLESRLTAKDDK